MVSSFKLDKPLSYKIYLIKIIVFRWSFFWTAIRITTASALFFNNIGFYTIGIRVWTAFHIGLYAHKTQLTFDLFGQLLFPLKTTQFYYTMRLCKWKSWRQVHTLLRKLWTSDSSSSLLCASKLLDTWTSCLRFFGWIPFLSIGISKWHNIVSFLKSFTSIKL